MATEPPAEAEAERAGHGHGHGPELRSCAGFDWLIFSPESSTSGKWH